MGFLISQALPVVWAAGEAVNLYIPEDTPADYAILLASGLAVLVLICFVAGIVARRALGKRFIALVEKYLLMLFPRYAIFKEQLSGNIGGTEFKNTMRPVVFHCLDYDRIAMEIERDANQRVTLFLPGSPDPWSGTVVVSQADKVQRLEVKFGDALAVFEQLGRKSLEVLDQHDASGSSERSPPELK